MKKLFAATQHYVVLALDRGGVSFPTTKNDIMVKAGKFPVYTDWDSYTPLSDFIRDVKLENYENKSQFFCACIGTITKF